jgi:ABC-type nitrate/sulfonate/bicarbonate transport system permease component
MPPTVAEATGTRREGAMQAARAIARRRAFGDPRKWRRIFVGVGSSIAAIALWYLATDGLHLVQPLKLPSPTAVVERIGRMANHPYVRHTLWGHASASIEVVIFGWLAGGIIGAPAGILMAWSRRFRAFAYPVFHILRPISPIAWIPLAVTWMGIGVSARVFIVFIAAVVPWVMNSMEAVHSVDPLMVRASRNLGTSSLGTLWRVVLPASLPTLMGGARVALGNAWTSVIAAELLAATSGLGFVALTAANALDSKTTFAAMAVIGAIGALLSAIMRGLARLLAPWAKGL